MKPERWQQISQLCNAALACDVAERSAFLRDACADDAELRSEIESLLRHEKDGENFLERPALEITANVAIQAQQQSMSRRRLGPYEILTSIGAGGMGEVYKAHDTRLKRTVAIKILSPEFSHDHDRRARFVREAQSIAALNHPHICIIHDVGQHDGVDYLVMEYLEGRTLRESISEGPLVLEEARTIAIEIAEALSQAHQRGIVHRDIKPGNIMLTKSGTKLLDFGLAKVIHSENPRTSDFETATGVVLGTAAYMSPEQLLGLTIDPRSDVFSLGVVLYEMVTGARPFRGANIIDTVDAILNKQPEPIESAAVPEDLRRVIYKCLEKKADGRFRSADEMLVSVKTGWISARGEGLSSRVHADVERTPSTTEQPAITERDSVLLADFANATGDPIFDGTLKEALAVKLDESPYLNIVSDDRVQQTLFLMGRSPNERLTAVVSREICERQGIKAMVTGSIAKLGRQYVITLTVVNCESGDSIARAQTDAANKEGVLSALGAATTRLREKLGESLASIKRFDMPMQDVTTSSLDALRAYSLACSLRAAGKEREAVLHLKYAIDLDPNFALAHAILAIVYRNLGELRLRDEHVMQAYKRRRRVTARERLFITGTYHKAVTGDLLKEFESLTLLQQTYPRYSPAFTMLGGYYDKLGQFARAADAFRETARLAPDAFSLTNLACTYINLNRLDEAKTMLEQAAGHTPQYAPLHDLRAQIACLEHDDAAKERELQWLTEHDPTSAIEIQIWVAGQAGKLRDIRELVVKLADLLTRDGLVERAAFTWLSLAEAEAACGVAEAVRWDVAAALKLASSRDVAQRAARILAMSGFQTHVRPLLEQCLKEYPPTHTLAAALYIPAIRAALELTHANAAAAIEALQPADPYDAGDYGVLYLRASAYLAADRPSDAAAEFQKVIDRAHGRSAFSPIAQLGRARALKRMGDLGGSRSMYESFFDLWKDADSDLPILVAAKQEYALLK